MSGIYFSDFKSLFLQALGDLGLNLPADAFVSFYRYYHLLLQWNKKINLTSLVQWQDVVIKHFIDSLSCFLIYSPPSGSCFIDIGSGAGFPGLPLKLARRDLQCTLLESVAKKVSFLQQVSSSLDLSGVQVVCGRAEEVARLEQYRGFYDLAVARAVAPLAVLLEYALPFLKTGGFFIAFKGPQVDQELASCDRALNILGGRFVTRYCLKLPVTGDKRQLILFEKYSETPVQFPRRPGIPRRRPL
ncbi:16S rRNA (guanine(527)-N(7))-methyltransferase RsmG [Desulfofundulus thermocisternus]|uniref:16S rRNA (guanine(527)-N(7))-methyltransferase RsmG n=1 Tax=Desulfofundulus thermocisternus TaxID=42471 RepID=UPI00217D5FEC|nr:16S rRNA (guanine(527)-N(7))-methyltransferase RsmG [Desulfofundulus thermocisternus]MCS5697047.1 16S rRNA (guanine(527)-N(7))-methyltransferase RsmG [Desulfofundulus thermocisternus]